jgi:hypothetical protein
MEEVVMSQKIYRVLKKIYATMMFTSFFAGALPIIPFIAAIFIGGKTGAAIYDFLFNGYFPWVIALGSLSIIVGLIAMYVGKIEDLSLKSMKKEGTNK